MKNIMLILVSFLILSCDYNNDFTTNNEQLQRLCVVKPIKIINKVSECSYEGEIYNLLDNVALKINSCYSATVGSIMLSYMVVESSYIVDDRVTYDVTVLEWKEVGKFYNLDDLR